MEITRRLGPEVQLIGDDLFVTDPALVARGVELGAANAMLWKVNQIGTLSEAFAAAETAFRNGYGVCVSERSGETEDPLIADLVVALNAGQIKTGSPVRGERTAKYNRLFQIEECLGRAGRVRRARLAPAHLTGAVSAGPAERRRGPGRRPASGRADVAARARFTNHAQLTGHGRTELRADALAIAAAALAAADPAANLRRILRLQGDRLVVTPPGEDPRGFDLRGRRIFVVGAGKATMGMAAVLDEILGGRIAAGVVVVKRGQALPLEHIDVLEAAHPVPDESSLAGGLRLLEIAAAAGPDDLLIAVVTGGSSALAVAPADGLTLADKIAVNRLLLACGADIVSVNQVRKHLSRLKGGRLARAAGCDVLNLTVSDVVGDPLDAVTDLTVPDASTFADARAVCDRWQLWDHLPTRVAAHLRRADPAQESCHSLRGVTSFVVADARVMCEAAVRAAGELGYDARLLRLDLEGESADGGRWFAEQLAAAGPTVAVVAGGEATTALLHGAGLSGGGGPSQDGALAGAVALGHRPPGSPPACVLCLDSDGIDGPGHAAGGLVDDLSAAALAAAEVDPQAALAAHASGTALEAAGDRVFTGPTGTNVNDLKLGLSGR